MEKSEVLTIKTINHQFEFLYNQANNSSAFALPIKVERMTLQAGLVLFSYVFDLLVSGAARVWIMQKYMYFACRFIYVLLSYISLPSPGSSDPKLSSRLSQVYTQLEAIEADKAPARYVEKKD